jgi:hypothetical protein
MFLIFEGAHIFELWYRSTLFLGLFTQKFPFQMPHIKPRCEHLLKVHTKAPSETSGWSAYDEHAWAKKRDSAKRLKPLVIKKYKSLICEPDMKREMLKRLREKHSAPK